MEELLNGVSVPAIAAVVYFMVEVIKYAAGNDEKVLRWVPVIAAGLGMLCGFIAFFAIPAIVPTNNIIVALVIGAASGLTATGFNQIIKQAKK